MIVFVVFVVRALTHSLTVRRTVCFVSQFVSQSVSLFVSDQSFVVVLLLVLHCCCRVPCAVLRCVLLRCWNSLTKKSTLVALSRWSLCCVVLRGRLLLCCVVLCCVALRCVALCWLFRFSK